MHILGFCRKLRAIMRWSLPLLSCLAMLTSCGGGGGGGGPTTSKKKFIEVRDTVGDISRFEPNDQKVPWGVSKIYRNFSSHYWNSKGMTNYLRLHSKNYNANARGRGVTVAVLDDGFDLDHPDLTGSFKRDAGGTLIGTNLTTQGKSWDFGLGPKPTSGQPERRIRKISHGTHVAGTIAARYNRFGVVGVAPETTILPIKFFKNNQPDFRYPATHTTPDELIGISEDLIEGLKFAKENGAFVANMSFSWSFRPHVKKIDLRPQPNRRDFLTGAAPPSSGFYLQSPAMHEGVDNFTKKLFNAETKKSWSALFGDNGFVGVVSAGNDRWNGETGRVKVYRDNNSDDVNQYLSDDYEWYEFSDVKVVDALKATGPSPNNPSFLSALFLGNPELKGQWLAVVATTQDNDTIAQFSNGCGEARFYCLAAPGHNITSTFASEDRLNPGDPDGYGESSGTSMAAPHVSGALAVLKSAYPNLTAKEAVQLLLCTADDKNSGDGPKKETIECLQTANWHEVKPKEGDWEPNQVYGHGLLNLAHALEDKGIMKPAGLNSNPISGALASNTRIFFSSAFGNAASGMNFNFGAFDMFNRSYSYRARLTMKSLPSPQLADVMGLTNALMSRFEPVQIDRFARSYRWSDSAISPIGAGRDITIKNGRAQMAFGFATEQRSTAFIPQSTMGGHSRANGELIWAKIAPAATDIGRGDAIWQLRDGAAIGAHFNRGTLGNPNSQSASYGFYDYAGSYTRSMGNLSFRLRAGRFVENGHFLGSKGEGGYALAQGSKSDYLHLSLAATHGDWDMSASATSLRTKVDFRHNTFVDDSVIDASDYAIGVGRRHVNRRDDRLSLTVKLPVAIDSGMMKQHSVRGYTASGDYKIVDDALDFSVTDRHQMIQLDYRAPVAPGVSWFASAALHKNWGNAAGVDNRMLFTGLVAKF